MERHVSLGATAWGCCLNVANNTHQLGAAVIYAILSTDFTAVRSNKEDVKNRK